MKHINVLLQDVTVNNVLVCFRQYCTL